MARQIDTPREHDCFRSAEKYFWASQLRMGTLYCESHLLSAQCAFFSGVYLSFTMRTLAAWKAFAQAGTNCLAYLRTQGLMERHRNSHQPVPTSPQDIDTPLQSEATDTSHWEKAEQRFRDDSLYWVILKGEA